jgi:hypothetical protein
VRVAGFWLRLGCGLTLLYLFIPLVVSVVGILLVVVAAYARVSTCNSEVDDRYIP